MTFGLFSMTCLSVQGDSLAIGCLYNVILAYTGVNLSNLNETAGFRVQLPCTYYSCQTP